MVNKNTAALRKRAQIAKANRTMFLWVAGASVIVSVSAVLGIMMFQKGMHNQKAISELGKTVSVLKKNNESVQGLEGQIRALGSNQSLLKLRVNDSDNALRVILDALPADPNPSALGASLQTKLFKGIAVESLQVMPLGGGEATSEEEATTETTEGSDTDTGVKAISFQFVVRGDAGQLKALLTRLEHSVRTIQISNLKMESASGQQSLSVEGEAYYLPAKTLQLIDTDIPS